MNRLIKRVPVTHSRFGEGKISHVRSDGTAARVVFKGRVTREVTPEHLSLVLKPGDIIYAKLSGQSIIAAVMWRLMGYPDHPAIDPTDTEGFLRAIYDGQVTLPGTVTERCHTELELGIQHNHVGVQTKAFWSLMKIGMRTGHGLLDPIGFTVEQCGTLIGIRPSGRVFEKAVNELVKWLNNKATYNPRFFGRHVRFRVIDDLRKERTASHRRQKDPSEMNPDTVVMGRPVGAYRYSKPEKFEMWKDTTSEWHRNERSDKGGKRRPYRSKSSKYRKPLAGKQLQDENYPANKTVKRG
jgi:hypothetical protein